MPELLPEMPVARSWLRRSPFTPADPWVSRAPVPYVEELDDPETLPEELPEAPELPEP